MNPSIASYPVPREWPPAKAPWQPEPGRAALLIHDMQDHALRFYQRDQPPLAVVLENVATLAAHCRARGVPVLYTCPSSEQDDFAGELAPRAGDVLISKGRYSAFQRTELLATLRACARDQLWICGVYAHLGCLLAAADALRHDLQAVLVSDGVADFSAHYHTLALGYAAERCGVTLDSATLLRTLDRRPALWP